MTPARSSSSLRDRVVDVALFAASAGAMLTEMVLVAKGSEGPLAAASIVLISLPILTRRRWPVGSYVAVMAFMFVLLSAGSDIYTTIAVSAVVCGFHLATTRGRRAALLTAAGTMPLVILILQTYSPHPLIGLDTAKNLGLIALPLALGVAAHDRRCYLDALIERAESAERTSEEEALRRVGEERLRIARDVHDVVAHAMVAINVQAGVGAHLIDRDPGQARDTLREIKRVSGEALGELRSMLGLLRSDDTSTDDPAGAPVHPTQGLAEIAALRARVEAVGIDLRVEVDPDAAGVPAALAATCYRIVQEALTNVMRHVGPTAVRVRIDREGDDLVIEVDDDGADAARPATITGTGSANGIRGMRERASALGGTLEAGPRPGGGWRVRAVLPAPVVARVAAAPVGVPS